MRRRRRLTSPAFASLLQSEGEIVTKRLPGDWLAYLRLVVSIGMMH